MGLLDGLLGSVMGGMAGGGQPQQGADADRRAATVLFADLVDSTALGARLDPEDMRAVINAYQRSCAEVVARYDGQWYFPILKNHPETTFGGDFLTPTEWDDPFIREQFGKYGNFAFFTFNVWGSNALDYYARAADPTPPSRHHWLGTDQSGRDMTARLLYGFRVSIYFALALTVAATVLGILIGAVQGYFAGRVDLFTQRIIEIWSAVPELYLLIILASILSPSIPLLIVVFALFGWIVLSDYVRALPPGIRSKDDIDRQVREERDSWS